MKGVQCYELFGGIPLKIHKFSISFHSHFHLSVIRFLLPKMNFGSSVLHIVAEPATDCCRYVGVVDTIEQLLMIHIVKCSCQKHVKSHFYDVMSYLTSIIN